MSRDVDPKYVNYPDNSEYGTGPGGYKYNRQGGMTYDSQALKNAREANEAREEARKNAAREQKEEEDRRSREPRRESYSAPADSGIAGLFLGTAGLALPFVFNGIIFIIIVLFSKIFAPVMPLFQLIWELFWMFLTCWLRVFKIWFTGAKYGTFFKDFRIRGIFPLEMAIAGLFLLTTLIRSFSRNDYWYEDNKNLAPLFIFPILELLHSFITIGNYNSYGHLLSIPNGIFLGMWVLIVMGWIIRFVNHIRYR